MMKERLPIQECPVVGARKRLGSELGVALILVLVLSAVGLVIMTTVLYVIFMGTQLSGSEKRYRTAHDAALGGIDVMRKIVQDQGAITIPGVTIVYQPSQAAFTTKLNADSLAAYDTSVSIDPNNTATYDLYVELGSPAYRVYAKLTQRRPGSTEKGYKRVRTKTGVVMKKDLGGASNFSFYTFTVLAQKVVNPSERVRMDLVHIF